MTTRMILKPAPNTSAGDAVHLRDIRPRTILVPMLNLSVAAEMVQLAGVLAAGPRFGLLQAGNTDNALPRVVVIGVVEVPSTQPLTTGLTMARSYRALLDFLPSEVEALGRRVRVDRIVKVARDVPSALRDAVADEGAGMVLLYWKGYARKARRHTYGRTADAILESARCDVALVRPEGWRGSKRVILPVRGGPSAESALSVSLALAEHLRVPLSVMHIVPIAQTDPDSSSVVEARGEEPYIVFNEHLKAIEQESHMEIDRILVVGGDPAASLLAELRQDDFAIMGTSLPVPHTENTDDTVAETEKPGAINRRVAEEKKPPLLILHTPKPIDLAGYRRKVKADRAGKSWHDMPFEHWFVENTYHGDEFKNPEAFLEAKRRSGLSISVALLTSNDAEHIHSVIVGLKRVLMEMHPIADQIAVIDANSTDGTVSIARSLGVDVYKCSELLADQGNLHGRGESWWKSLAVLRGDLLVWLDPRARRFHPSAAISLAGPLLRVSTLQFVKAYGQSHSDKPNRGKHKIGAGELAGVKSGADYAPVDMSWGGFMLPRPDVDYFTSHIRVQALKPEDLQALDPAQIATLPPRTIMQVLCPALAGVISPFGREMAGRREAMMSLPAFVGENLEVGLLLSVASKYGAHSIAQVELRQAHPAPPPPPGLRYSLDTLQALAHRLQDPAMAQCATETAERLQKSIEGRASKTPEGTADSSVFEVRALGPLERPPMGPTLEERSRTATLSRRPAR